MSRVLLRSGVSAGLALLVSLAAVPFLGNTRAQSAKRRASGAVQPASIGHIGHLDYRNGFRGWRFGALKSEFTGLNLEQNLGNMKLYTRNRDDLLVGQAHLQRIVYHFVDDRFMGVSLFTKGRHDSHTLLQILQAAYGPGVRPHADQNEYWWRGHVANARYSEDGAPDEESEVWIGNNALQDMSSRYQKALLEGAASSI